MYMYVYHRNAVTMIENKIDFENMSTFNLFVSQ